MEAIVKVNMGDYKTCDVSQKITTIGLGSCVGVVLYDTVNKKCGMLHAMLPDSTRIRNNMNRMKFVDTGLEDLIALMIKEGAVKRRMIAKLAGGAKMFDFGGDSDEGRIGFQNVQATKEHLAKYGIPIVAEDTGDSYGRTIVFDPAKNELEIKTIGKPVRII